MAGHALARDFLGSRFERFSKYTSFVGSSRYRAVLAVVSILIGLINLFPTYSGNTAVLGDFLPSLAGIGVGIMLLMELSKSRKGAAKTGSAEAAEETEKISGPFSNIVGVCSIIIGLLHAILPRVPLL